MMEPETRQLSFSVAGSFITAISREWFWLEGKPWETVEDLLLSCMHGTDQTKSELKRHAFNVVFGLEKFVGNTGDGSYALVEDNDDLAIKNVTLMKRDFANLKENHEALMEQYNKLLARIEDEALEWLLLDEKEDREEVFEMSPILKSFMDQVKIEEKFDNNYGWLEPSGEFHPVPWCDHQEWAMNEGKRRGWIPEDEHDLWAAGDVLADHGWVLLHNPGKGVAFVTRNEEKRLTKAQQDFLYSYYADRGQHKTANKFLEG